jgi:hypothetical protein
MYVRARRQVAETIVEQTNEKCYALRTFPNLFFVCHDEDYNNGNNNIDISDNVYFHLKGFLRMCETDRQT